MKQILLYVIGTLTGLLPLFRATVIRQVRLKQKHTTLLMRLMREGRNFIIKNEVVEAAYQTPSELVSISWIHGMFLYISIQERMLQAGWSGTDSVATVYCLRWHYNKLTHLLHSEMERKVEKLPVYIMQAWDVTQIGEIDPEQIASPLVSRDLLQEVEGRVEAVIRGERSRTGLLFYGAPGNGKTYMVKHLAARYRLPIYILSLFRSVDNHSLIRMFSNLKPGIVLLEDFDNYFDGRIPMLEKAEFTFDTLLNVIDGAYSTNSGLIFIMTANNIDRIDPALKVRPSRFSFVREFTYPDVALCRMLMDKHVRLDDDIAAMQGLSLDGILMVKNAMDSGYSFGKALQEYREMEALIETEKVRLLRYKEEQETKKDADAPEGGETDADDKSY